MHGRQPQEYADRGLKRQHQHPTAGGGTPQARPGKQQLPVRSSAGAAKDGNLERAWCGWSSAWNRPATWMVPVTAGNAIGVSTFRPPHHYPGGQVVATAMFPARALLLNSRCCMMRQVLAGYGPYTTRWEWAESDRRPMYLYFYFISFCSPTALSVQLTARFHSEMHHTRNGMHPPHGK